MYGPFYDLNFTSVLLVPEPQALMIFYAVGLDLVSINSPFIAYSELVAKFSSAQHKKIHRVCQNKSNSFQYSDEKLRRLHRCCMSEPLKFFRLKSAKLNKTKL